ncbi:hypothetical protein Rvan_0377 [Rhodomicrobium vannielii ATCC 17100]|jgi:hypothetical protein|uniref:Uncharacterized protein n=1 Tax=Rhodomicrobium vannielii (strain ATCC 17100 / DSM 162 / LMG 4299 / NCIMB 10020 / ATH 3.1.1) TaxID=648757 RepID=E3I7P7_RHOVT|nr:hypothetical protein [Rhodomicrobium vannielii]ADP69663.1 hypothetical protein Rvan_0377 [Rhodomicrobium vannielii ATCC 17100]
MSHKHHLSGEAADAALRFGAFGALISGGIVAGQSISAAQQGDKSVPQAVTDTLAAATKAGIAAAVGGAAAAAVGGHGFSRVASFLAGAAAAAWVMSPPRRPTSISDAAQNRDAPSPKKSDDIILASSTQGGNPKAV